jgi:hypothetical protein
MGGSHMLRASCFGISHKIKYGGNMGTREVGIELRIIDYDDKIFL